MSYSYPLYGAWQKIVRAEEHLKCLHAETRKFLEGTPNSVRKKLDNQASTYVFYVESVDEPPTRLALIVGDYIHNLRSALDHLAWQLALQKYGGSIPRCAERDISFPIAKSVQRFDSFDLSHFCEAHVALLRTFQPQHGEPDHPLVLLNDMWNTDKHRLLHVVQVSLGERSPRFTGNADAEVVDTWYPPGKELEVGAKIGCAKFVRHGLNPDVDMDTLPVRVRFGNCPDSALNSLRSAAFDALNLCHEAFFGG